MSTTYSRLATPADRHKMHKSWRVKILIGVMLLLIVLLVVQRRKASVELSDEDSGYVARWSHDTMLNRVYAITPTYGRPVQKAELTRISHVVQLSPNIHWIIVEDSIEQSQLVRNVVKTAKIGHRVTVLNEPTPKIHKQKVPNYQQPRGVSQRNVALQWVRDNAIGPAGQYHQSVVFFMDDDNTYSVELFQEMANIQPGRVGIWPVGLVGGLMVEKPMLEDNVVVGFNSQWRPERPFPVDMAGFAISVDLLLANPEAKFSYDVERGYQETEILRQVTTMDKLQPLADLCRKVLVWHTRTELPKLGVEEKLNKKNIRSNDGMEV